MTEEAVVEERVPDTICFICRGEEQPLLRCSECTACGHLQCLITSAIMLKFGSLENAYYHRFAGGITPTCPIGHVIKPSDENQRFILDIIQSIRLHKPDAAAWAKYRDAAIIFSVFVYHALVGSTPWMIWGWMFILSMICTMPELHEIGDELSMLSLFRSFVRHVSWLYYALPMIIVYYTPYQQWIRVIIPISAWLISRMVGEMHGRAWMYSMLVVTYIIDFLCVLSPLMPTNTGFYLTTLILFFDCLSHLINIRVEYALVLRTPLGNAGANIE